MSSREEILQNVRRAIHVQYEMPDLNELEAVAQKFPDKIQTFQDVMKAAGGNTIVLKEGENVMASIDSATDTILTVEIPVKVVLKVTYTEPGVKGDTATNATKPATVETGAQIRVPLFINEGDLIEIDTRDGSYVTRK